MAEKNNVKIVFRVDSGPSVGMGHIYRCLSLAIALQEKYTVSFFLNEGSQAEMAVLKKHNFNMTAVSRTEELAFLDQLNGDEVVIMDGYIFTGAFQLLVKQKGCRLVFIDDMASFKQVADIVINHAANAAQMSYTQMPYTRLLLGPGYALLRPYFMQKHVAVQPVFPPQTVMVTMGGLDETNLTYKFVKWCSGFSSIKKIQVVCGPLYAFDHTLKTVQGKAEITVHKNIDEQQMGAIMLESDCIICTASVTLIESIALGRLCLAGYSVENQHNNYTSLMEKKVMVGLGNLHTLQQSDFSQRLAGITASEWEDFRKNMNGFVDGNSISRIVTEIEKLTMNNN